MELQYYLPRADLRDYVRAYYYFSTDITAEQPMCAELGNIRVILDGSGHIQLPDGSQTPISGAFLLGPTMGAYKMYAHAGTKVFGIGVRPRGWDALFGFDAHEAADCAIDLSACAGRIAHSAIEELSNMQETPPLMAAAADRLLATMIEKRTRKACVYPDALEHWLLNQNDLNLDRLMAMMDLSRRQTDRLAKRYFGASPKMLQRKYRALRAADRFRAGENNWLNAAGEHFYDQSHFISEFKTFIGFTPRQFMTGQGAALIETIQKNRHIEKTPAPLASV